MNKIDWFSIQDLYNITSYKIKHKKNPKTKWIKLPCVYKIKIKDTVVHVGRSDTCKKHGGAEKVRKAIVNLLNVNSINPSVPTTKYWTTIRLKYKPNSSNIYRNTKGYTYIKRPVDPSYWIYQFGKLFEYHSFRWIIVNQKDWKMPTEWSKHNNVFQESYEGMAKFIQKQLTKSK